MDGAGEGGGGGAGGASSRPLSLSLSLPHFPSSSFRHHLEPLTNPSARPPPARPSQNTVIALALVAGVVAARRPDLRLGRWQLLFVIAVGIGDTIGNALFAASSGKGLVSLTAVLASLYPIVTVILAAVVLKERVAPLQKTGIALTVAGVLLISA